MIHRIRIKEKSYKEKLELDVDKKFNFFYGVNGSGKTVLSNFLKKYKDNTENIKGLDNNKILVYNQNFINENFYEQDNLKGIFTLSEVNGVAEKNIKDAETEIQKLKNQKEEQQAALNQIGNKQEKEKSEITEKVWDIKKAFSDNNKTLDYCLEGLKGSKSSLFEHIIKKEKPSIKPTKTIEDLKNEILKIGSDKAAEIALLQKIKLIEIENIEKEPIFDEVIVGNKNSIVADLIEKFKNSDWVKQGLSYLENEITKTKNCPFCQQNITESIIDEIKNYFDKTYEDKINSLNKIKSQYQEIKNNIPVLDSFLVNDYAIATKTELENSYRKLLAILSQNTSAIGDKIKHPSNKIILESSSQALEDFNGIIEKINRQIIEHNEKIKNKKTIKEIIEKEFWDIMRWEYDVYIQNYKNNLENSNKEKEEIKNIIKKIEDDIKYQENIKKENEDKTINVGKPINSINYQLKCLGLNGFEIKPYEDRFYRIVREGEDEPNFKSLSEGEKMIVSFLYFMELCRGKENETEEIQDKIIVIDDPISSLSHNYIFNIAQFIRKEFLDMNTSNYMQVFILTHNMYFFTEIIYYFKDKKEKEYNLFRITKDNNNSSTILPMSKGEIQNDYQAYWAILKDHKEGNAQKNILANSMRNILENFFGFIDKKKLKESMKKLDSMQYGAFLRYINRESHSDQTNISDFKEIDVNLFTEAFKKIFEESGNIEHYNRMMDIKTGATDE